MKITTLAEILACKPDKCGWRTLPDDNGVKIGYGVVIGGAVEIGTDVEIGNGAVIVNDVEIGDGAKIGNYVVIGDGAKIGNAVEIGNGAVIGDGVEINRTPTYIQGSRFFMSQVTDDGLTIQSGCITKPLSWWRENIRRCAEEYEYTPEQVEEYAAYIDLFTKQAELR